METKGKSDEKAKHINAAMKIRPRTRKDSTGGGVVVAPGDIEAGIAGKAAVPKMAGVARRLLDDRDGKDGGGWRPKFIPTPPRVGRSPSLAPKGGMPPALAKSESRANTSRTTSAPPTSQRTPPGQPSTFRA